MQEPRRWRLPSEWPWRSRNGTLIESGNTAGCENYATISRHSSRSAVRRQSSTARANTAFPTRSTLHFFLPEPHRHGPLREGPEQHFHVAEYWMNDQSWVIRPTSAGAGFDGVWSPRLRDGVRGAIGQAAGGAGAFVALDTWSATGSTLRPVSPRPGARSIASRTTTSSSPVAVPGSRVLSDSSDSRSWYARSRAGGDRLALDCPGNPAHFHGRNSFLEDKQWSDSDKSLLIDWDGLSTEKILQDHFTIHARADRTAESPARASRRSGERVPRARRQPGDRLSARRLWARGATWLWRPASTNRPTGPTPSAFPALASGSKSSTATCTITGSTRSSPVTDRA